MIEIRESCWIDKRTIIFPWKPKGVDSFLNWSWEVEEQLYAQMMGWA